MTRKKIISLCCLAGLCITATIAFVVFVVKACFFPLKVNDIDKYMKQEKSHYGALSEYILFPDEPLEIGEVEEYHFYDYNLDGGIELYLEINFDADGYENEINRLENLSNELFHYHEDEKPRRYIKKDDAFLFNKTAYVTMYNHYGKYEYAIIDEENLRIHYICIECMTEALISFDLTLLPKNYYSGADLSKENTDQYTYNIYTNSKINWYE